jgi:hypothetical protein
MNEIFQDLITEGVVSIYLDDILIFISSIKEHRHITQLVLDWMDEHKLYLWPEKCKFEKTQIEYLGVIISHNKVKMDPVKITSVADYKGTSIYSLTSLASNPFQSCLYVFPTVSVHIQPHPHHSDAIIDTPCWYSNIQWFRWLHCNQHQCLATTIAHIRIVSHDPMAPSNGRWTFIFGRLGTRRLGTVISTISSVVWSSQGSLECSLWISLG